MITDFSKHAEISVYSSNAARLHLSYFHLRIQKRIRANKLEDNCGLRRDCARTRRNYVAYAACGCTFIRSPSGFSLRDKYETAARAAGFRGAARRKNIFSATRWNISMYEVFLSQEKSDLFPFQIFQNVLNILLESFLFFFLLFFFTSKLQSLDCIAKYFCTVRHLRAECISRH